jgi:hypothetical protein
MTNYNHYSVSSARVFALPALLSVLVSAACAQSVQHLSKPYLGGMPGAPVVTGIEQTTNQVIVSWDGPSGYYQLFGQTNFGGPWTPIGGRTNAIRRAVVPMTYSNAFFKVSGPAPRYVGAQACAECHRSIHNAEKLTAHAGAFTSPAFAASGGQKNPSCLPCHTVGYGLPTGFTNITKTPNLAGVQCESCHGPGAVHAANPDDPIYRPRVEIASTVCGGCHTSSHHPTYEEWSASGHSVVTEDMNPTNRISSCGRCHSGSARLALIKNDKLPAGDANMPVGCVNCHDPHRVTGNPAQLINPVRSTNDFFLTTSENFQAKYSANTNASICAQCHNHRGANWESTTSPPHHSPQYNMMLGTVGLSHTSTNLPPRSSFSHADMLENQCVTCHMQQEEFSASASANTGHNFGVYTYEACLECHPYPELLTDIVTAEISDTIQLLKTALDEWALTKAPETLRVKYGVRAWEYTTAGSLSGGSGPSTAEQALIPVAIKKARFNLYIAYYDGSFGVHNPSHTARLLDSAEEWIREELNK